MPDKTDAKKILTASTGLENWRRPPGRRRTPESYPAAPDIQKLLPE